MINFGFLKSRAATAKARQQAKEEQEGLRIENERWVADAAKAVKSMLMDGRYLVYKEMLTTTRASLAAEREAVLQAEDDRDARDHQAAILTGRIMQIDLELSTPQKLFALKDEGTTPNGNGRDRFPISSAARSPAREPVGNAA